TTQQGRDRDDWGNWFGCTSSELLKYYPLTDHYLARNPFVAPFGTEVNAARDAMQLYPLGDLTLFRLSGPPGRPTSVCGLGIYRDDYLGAEYRGNAFLAEPVNQLVCRRVLASHGVTFTAARAPDEERQDFLASTENMFRPVQIRTGLD